MGSNRLALTEVELGYIAGLIDGEGTIGISMDPNFRLHLIITNTSMDLMNWLSLKLESKYRQLSRASRPSSHKDVYQITLYGEGVKSLLRQLGHLLIIKAPHARVALEFPQPGAGNDMTEEMELKQALCRVNLMRLNKKGREV